MKSWHANCIAFGAEDWCVNEDFSFLREMLIKDDPEFPEPEEKKWTGFENE